MKTHIGVDSKSKLIHSVAVTPANTHDSQVLDDLLHGEETKVWEIQHTAVRKTYCQNTPSMRKTIPRKRANEIGS